MNIPMSPCPMAGKRRTGSSIWSWKPPMRAMASAAREGAGLIAKEFDAHPGANYPHYFLTVHDIVHYARTREPPILCQGRGSAANSIVCFLLGVTSVDPMQHDLLFTRFLSKPSASEPPDIDVDFEHERREEVIQYMLAGAMAASARALPRPSSIIARAAPCARSARRWVSAKISPAGCRARSGAAMPRPMSGKRVVESGFDPDSPEIARLNHFVQQHPPIFRAISRSMSAASC